MGTQYEDKQKKNTTQYVLDTTMEVKVGFAIGLWPNVKFPTRKRGHDEESNGPPMNYDPFGSGCKSLKLRAKLIWFYKYEALIYVLYVWRGA